MRLQTYKATKDTRAAKVTRGGFVLLMLLVAISLSPAQESKGTILIDQAHGQLFSPSKDGGLDYSTFASMFKNAGYEMRVTNMRVNSAMLHGVSAYIVSGPFQEFTPAEIIGIRDWIAKGGRLVVLLHISQSVARLTETFGIVVSNVPVHERDEEKLIDEASTDFTITPVGTHELLRGIGAIDFYGSFAVLPEGQNVTSLAMTSDVSFADINGSNTFDEGDVSQPFCVMAVAQWGLGEVLVLGDDAMLSNAFISKADNGVLAANIVMWAGGKAAEGQTEGNNAW